ncbi:cytochrome P450 [Lepidopterella palustris CBS 459.81]|uniref:Cytochrome P450 n=1 Tax=Lepidopterella palustris CBS 459.81 TaxID=1314670 RepID=A0A8E2E9Y5_9PEZI|nr:cytochrome P450 [Lepidopterella palustris CBS 459.81]
MFLTYALLLLLVIPCTLTAWSAWTLAVNRAKADKAHVPILTRYVAPTNPLWIVFGNFIIALFRRLPFGSGYFTRFYLHGWEAKDRYKIHLELEAILEIPQRRKDFKRNVEQMAVLDIYGKNLSTTDDQEWQKHRKATAATFTERNNELVWIESLNQAKSMLQYWNERAPHPIRTLSEDARTFTLNVLAAALLSKTYPFKGCEETQQKAPSARDDFAFRYRDSLSKILQNIVPIFIFGTAGLTSWWMPTPWKKAGYAVYSLRAYEMELISEERHNIAHGKKSAPNLVTALVRACEEEQKGGDAKRRDGLDLRKFILTEEEIISDLFVYAFAGNDTTAITLAHTLMETLRLCHPLGQLVKTTGNKFQTIKIGSKVVTIPLDTMIHANMSAHPMDWNPGRWISSPADNTHQIEDENLLLDTTGCYLPWASGQRVCPGKKFLQVELVAVLAKLFRGHRLEPELEKGETIEAARKRSQFTTQDVQVRFLNEMRSPASAGVR